MSKATSYNHYLQLGKATWSSSIWYRVEILCHWSPGDYLARLQRLQHSDTHAISINAVLMLNLKILKFVHLPVPSLESLA